ncbi:MAG: T9SS type A sorting domain-containing protein [Chitinophagales bacterium]
MRFCTFTSAKLLFALILLLLFGSANAATITWADPNNGGVWTTGTNWTGGVAPGPNDDVVFSPTSNIVVTGTPTIILGSLTVNGSADVSLQGAAAVTVTISANSAANDLDVQSGSLTVATNVTLTMAAGSNANVATGATLALNAGTFSTAAAASTTVLVDGTFNAGGTLTLGTGSVMTVDGTFNNPAASVTLTSTAATLQFTSGSIYNHQRNGGVVPTATWNANSTVNITGLTTTNITGFTGQTFGKFNWNCTGQTITSSMAIASATFAGDFTVVSTGTGALGFNTAASTVTLSANLNVQGGTLNFNNGAAVITTLNLAGNLNVTGGTLQRGTATSNQNLNFTNAASNKTLTVSGGTFTTTGIAITVNLNAIVTLANNLTVATSFTNSGTLFCGTNIISGTGSFVLTNAATATLGIGDPAGITTAPTAAGNIQTTTRTYNTLASLIYNGSVAQVTGNGLATTWGTTNTTITINNTAGVTLTQALTLGAATNASIVLQDGQFILGANNLTIPTLGTVSTPSAFNSTRMIVADGTGQLIKSFPASAAAFLYPIGDKAASANGAEYTPVNLNFTANNTARNIGFRSINTRQPNDFTYTVNYLNRYWPGTISVTTGTFTLNADFTYSAADVVGTESLLKLNSYNSITTAFTQYTTSLVSPTLSVSGYTDATFTMLAAIDFTGRAKEPVYYRSTGTGAWSSLSTWEVSSDINFISPAPITATVAPNDVNSDGIFIKSGDNVSLTASTNADDITVDGTLTVVSAVGITIGNGNGTAAADMIVNGTIVNSGSLLFNRPGSLIQVNGTITNNSGGVVTGTAATLNFASGSTFNHALTGGAIPIATWNANSLINVTGIVAAAPTGISGQILGKLTWNCSGQTAALSMAIVATTTFGGDFTVVNTGTGSLILSGATTTVNMNGDLIVQGGTLNLNNGTSTVTTLNLGGNFNQTAGTITVTGTSPQSLNFTGVGKTYSQSGTFTNTLVDPTVGVGASLTLNSPYSVPAIRTFTVNGALYCGNNIISGAGNFILANSSLATLGIGNAGGIAATGATGNIQTTGRLFNVSASLVYNGTVPQVTGTGLATTWGSAGNITINNPAGVSLTQSLTLNNTTALILQSGVLTLGAFNLSIPATGSITTPGSFSSTNMIAADGTGQLIKFITGGATVPFIYPVGDVTGTAEYSPVVLGFNSSASAGSIGVRVVNGTPPGAPVTNYLNRNWVFTTTGLTSYNYTLSLGYNAADVVGSTAAMQPSRYNGTTWTQIAGTVGSNTVNYTATLTNTSAPLGSNTFTAREGSLLYYRSVATGDWNNTSTWEADVNPAFTAPSTPAAAPTSTNSASVLVRTGHTVTATAAVTAFEVSVDGTLENGTGGTITATGGITFNANSTYSHNRDGGAIPSATWHTTSTCLIKGAVSTATITGFSGQTFGKFTWNSPSQTAAVSLGAIATTTVNGDFTVISTGSGSVIPTASAVTINLNGDLIVQGGTLNLNNAATAAIYNLAGNFNQSGGTVTATSTSIQNLNFTGVNKTFTQAGTFTNTTIQPTVNLGASLTLNNNYVVPTGRTFTVNGALYCGSNIVSGAGGFTLTGATTATLGIGDANGVNTTGATGNIQTTTRTLGIGANLVYNGTVAQLTGNILAATWGTNGTTITIDNPAGVTLSQSLTFTAATSAGIVLKQGQLILGANSITMPTLGTISTPTSFGASNMIVADGAGQLIKTFPASAASFLFPIGDSNGSANGAEYTPVNWNFTTNATSRTLGLRVIDAIHPNEISYTVNKLSRYWPCTSNSTAAFTANADFTYSVANDVSGTESQLKLNTYEPTTTAFTEYTSTVSSPVLSVTGVTNAVLNLSTAFDFVGRAKEPVYYRSTGSTAWNTLSTWEVSSDPSFTSPAPVAAIVLPTAANSDGVLIKTGDNVSLPASVSIDDLTIAGTLTVNAAQTLTILNGAAATDMTVNGSIVNNGILTLNTASSVCQINGTITNNTGGTVTGTAASLLFGAGSTYNHALNGGVIPTATWNATSLLNITGVVGTAPTGFTTQTFGKLTWNSTGQTATLSMAAATMTCNGDFTVVSTGTGQTAFNTTTTSITLNGDFVIQGGTFSLCNSATTTVAVVNLSGNFNQSGGTLQRGTSTGTQSFNFVNGSLSRTYTQSGGTFTTTGIGFAVSLNAALTLNSAISVASSFTNSGTLYCGNNIISGAGSFILTNAATATLGIGNAGGIATTGAIGNIQTTTRTYGIGANLVYNGTTAQVTGTGLAATWGTTNTTVTINNTAGVTLSQNLAFTAATNGSLVLQDGQFILGANNLTIPTLGTISTPTSFGSNRMVVADGTGQVLKTIPTGASAFLFPIGDNAASANGAEYSPVNLNFSANATSGNIGVKVTNTAHPSNGTAANYFNRYWTFTTATVTTYTYTADFTYTNNDVVGTLASINAARYNAGLWGGYTSTNGSNTLTVTTSPLNATTAALNGSDWTGRETPGLYYYRTHQSGNWSDVNTWDASLDPAFPTYIYPVSFAPDDYSLGITIRLGHTVTVNANVSCDQLSFDNTLGSTLNIDNGAIFTLLDGAGTDLTFGTTANNSKLNIVNGKWLNKGTWTNTPQMVVSGGATYQHDQNAGVVPTATWLTNSTCLFTGPMLSTPTGLGQTFANVTYDCPAQGNNLNFTGGFTTINGNFTLVNTNGWDVRLMSSTGTTSVTINGNLDLQSGIFYLSSGTSVPTLTIGGDLLIKPGAAFGCNITGSATGTVNLGGNFTQTGGTFSQASTGTITWNFTGANKQFTQSAGTFTPDKINFNINTAGASLTLNNDFTINTPNTFSITNGSLICGANLVKGTGTFTLTSSANATLGIGHANGIVTAPTATGNIQTTTRTYGVLANYAYSSTAANTGNGFTAGTSLSVNGATINLTSPATLSGSTGALSLTNALLSLGANDLTLSNTAATITGGTTSSTNMVITNGTGVFRRTLAAAVATHFYPIGTTTGYSPVTLNFATATASSTIGIRAIDGIHPNMGGSADYLDKYWSFVTSGGTYTLNSIVLGYAASDVTGTETALATNLWTGSTWAPVTTTVNTTAHTLTSPTSGTLTDVTFPLNGNTVTGRTAELNYYRSNVVSGNWESPSSWIISTDVNFASPAGVAATVAPTADNSLGITIMSGHTITVTAGNPAIADQLTISNAANTALTVASGATLTIANGLGNDLTLAGTTARLNVNGTLTNNGVISGSTAATTIVNGIYDHAQNGGTIPTTTWNTGSTCLISGTTTTVPSGFQAFRNFTWNCPSQNTVISLGAGLTTINENFTVQNTGTQSLSLGTTGFTLNLTGDLILNGGTLNLNSGAAVSTILNISGNYNQTAGALTCTATSASTINFLGTGKTYTQSGGTVTNTTINYAVNAAAATLTLNDNITIPTGRSFTVSTGTLNMQDKVISGAGTFTLTSTSTASLGIGSANGITTAAASGNIQTTTRTYGALANYNYNGTVPQVTGNAFTAGTLLSISNSAGVTETSPANAVNLALNNGVLNTSTGALLTLTGTGAIQGAPSGTACVSGPMVRTIPVSQSAALTLLYPLGKGGDYNPLEIVNPTTSSGGAVTVQAEVFNANSAGTAGPGISALNTNRYWQTAVNTGPLNITSYGSVRLTENTPALVNGNSVIGQSSTVNGTYGFRGGAVSSNTIATQSTLSAYSYFTIGDEGTISCPSPVLKVGPGGDFSSVTEVSNILNLLPVNCDLIFEFVPTYNSSVETFPITFNQFTYGPGGPFSVTFRPSATATTTISGSSATQLINFNGADKVIFDGRQAGTGTPKNLTITNTNTSGSTIQFVNDATNIALKYLSVRGVETSGTNGVIVFGTTTGTSGNDNITIDNCDLGDGASKPTNIIYASGTSLKENDNISITNNNIFNFFSATIGANGINLNIGNTAWFIDNNNFYQTTSITPTSSTTNVAISIVNSTGTGFTVTNNDIGGNAAGATGTWTVAGTAQTNMCGIYINVSNSGTNSVQANVIRNFSIATTSSFATQQGIFTGIYVGSGFVDIGGVIGNIIGSTSIANSIDIINNPTVSLGNVNGIKVDGTSGVNIQNNTISGISLRNPSSIAFISALYGIYATTSSGTGTDVINITGNNIGNASLSNALSNATGNTYATATTTYTAGIFVPSSVRQVIINSNNIANIAYTSAASGNMQTIGIYRGNTTASANNQINDNIVSGISSAATYTGAGTNAGVVGIHFTSSQSGHSIARNTVHTLSNTATAATVHVIGIFYSPSTGSGNVVERNFIHSFGLSSTAVASTINGIYDNAGNAEFRNNMIRLGINAAGSALTTGYIINGINEIGGTNTFYHNSVYIGGAGVTTATNQTACFKTAVTTGNIRNNIFSNQRSGSSGRHYSIVLGGATIAACDYNIYSSASGNVLSTNGGTNTFATPQAVFTAITNQNLHSGFGDPNFINATGNATAVNLHLNASNPAEGVGVSIGSVTDDIDGQVRSSYSPVDIGADADNFTTPIPAANDIYPPVPTYTAISNQAPCGAASNVNLTATITDAGSGVPTSGGNAPRIYFRRSAPSATAWASTAGTLASGNGNNGTWTFTIDYTVLGVAPVAGETYQYFVAAQDQATNPVNPNIGFSKYDGTTPTFTNNNVNSLVTAPTTPDSYTYLTAFSGVVTVGTGGTYTTFNGASGLFNALNNGVLVGDVTVQVISDINETAYTPLTALSSSCGGPWTVTITPNNTTVRTISGANSQSMIVFNGASRVTIDGSFGGSGNYLVWRNTQAHPAFWLNAGANNITIKNSQIESANTNSTAGAGVIVMGGPLAIGSGVTNITIDKNIIREKSVGAFAGYSKYLILSSNISGTNGNISITNNELANWSIFSGGSGAAAAIEVGTNGGSNYTITGNSLYNNFIDGTGQQYGIDFRPGSSSIANTISGNYIGGSAALCGGANPWRNNTNSDLIPLYLSVGNDIANPTVINGNTIQNINQQSGDAGGVTCIWVAAGRVNITNNLIGHPTLVNSIQSAGGGLSLSTNTGWMYGVYSQTANPLLVQNNTIAGLSSVGSYRSYVTIIEHTGTGTLTATGNTLANTYNGANTSGYNTIGIYVSSSATGNNISGNTISKLGSSSAGPNGNEADGIIVKGASSGTIDANKLTEFFHVSNGGFTAGITTAGTGNWIVSNNMLNMLNQSWLGSYTTRKEFYGILDYASGGTNKYHYNTVLIQGSQTGTSGVDYPSECFYKLPGGTGSGNGDVTQLRNNIFINNRTGNPTANSKHYAIDNTSTTPSANWSSDYNFFSTNNDNTLAYWNGAGDRTFAQWQSSSGGDSHSTWAHALTSGTSSAGNTNPADLFVNINTGDLHINPSPSSAPYPYISVYDNGVSVAPTTMYDFDGTARPQGIAEDMGADEFVICTATITATINGGSTATVCNGATVNLSASGAVNYTWSSNPSGFSANTATTTATPTTNTTYKVVGIDGNGCIGNATVTAVLSPGTINIYTSSQTILAGESASLVASASTPGAMSYSWSPCATLDYSDSANAIASPLTSTTYTVTVTDANACTATASATINVGTAATPSGQVSCGYSYNYVGTNTWVPLTSLSGTPVSLASGTGAGMDNTQYPTQSIGFNFTYNGGNYTSVGVSSNGYLWFGTGSPSATNYSPLSSTTGQTGLVDGIISVFGGDVSGRVAGSTLKVITTGSAPNRVFVAEWLNVKVAPGTNRGDYQVRLYEGTNKVELWYNVAPYMAVDVWAGQVGMRGNTTADFTNRQVDCSQNGCSASWANSTQGSSNGALCYIDGGAGYCYTNCSNSPYPGSPGAVGGQIISYTPNGATVPIVTASGALKFCLPGNSVNLTSSAAASYQWYLNDNPISGATSQSLNAITARGAYTVKVPATGCGIASAPNVVSSGTSVTASVTVSPGSLCNATSGTFTATGVNGGCAPVYQWKLNGANVGTNSPSYTNSSLTPGDSVQVVMTSTKICATPSAPVSNTVLDQQAGRWIGVVSSDWHNAANWCPGIPTSTTDVIIPVGVPNYPVITATAISRNLTVNTGATVTISSGILQLHGDLTVNGSYTHTNGVLQLAGSSTQTLSGITAYDIKMGNSAGAVLNGDLVITHSIDFADGIITTGSNKVEVTNTATSAVSGSSLSSYINGTLKRAVNSSGTYVLPVGTSSQYELAEVKLNSNPDITALTANFNTSNTGCSQVPDNSGGPFVNGTALTDLLDGGFWTIHPTPSTYSGLSYDVTLKERGYSNGASSNPASYAVIKRDDCSSAWQSLGTHSNATQSISSGTITAVRSALTSFSDFGVGLDAGGPLPVELIYLSADAVNNTYIRISWATALEINNSGFSVERSTDGINFYAIGWVNGNNNSTVQQTYSLNDNNVVPGTVYYYRLKQIDNDGQFEYTYVVSAVLNGTTAFEVKAFVPNPTNALTNLLITSDADKQITVEFYNVLGEKVISETHKVLLGANQFTFDLSALASGTYTAIVTSGSERLSKKLVVTH